MLKYEIKPEVEIFDLAMLYNAVNLVKKGLLLPPPYVQFVMGVPNAMPVRRTILEFLIKELKDVMPNATWTAAGIGKNQLVVNEWALELGGHVRTGLEDNIRFDESRIAKDDAELVSRLANMARNRGRPVATVLQARQFLGLRLIH